jgi:hypothetical protein
MSTSTSLAELQERLAAPTHLWVVSYGITHSVMVLAIHAGQFIGYEELVAGGCVSFRGELQGGPYRIRVAQAADDLLYVRDEDGTFELVCSRLRLTGQRGPRGGIHIDGPEPDRAGEDAGRGSR